MYNDNNKQTF